MTLEDVKYSPWVTRPLRSIKVLLFTPGLGWLRWGRQLDYVSYSYYEPPEPVCYYPPLRRWGIWLWSRVHWLLRAGGWYRDGIFNFTSGETTYRWNRAKYGSFVYSRKLFVYNMDEDFPGDYL